MREERWCKQKEKCENSKKYKNTPFSDVNFMTISHRAEST